VVGVVVGSGRTGRGGPKAHRHVPLEAEGGPSTRVPPGRPVSCSDQTQASGSFQRILVSASCKRIFRRMPRLQVYLPNDLSQKVKGRSLPASEFLQEAVRAELRRQDLLQQTDSYLDELVADVGEPSLREVARAEAKARRIRDHRGERTG
jgi:post-segregation antitoxin (ccd killing protein)